MGANLSTDIHKETHAAIRKITDTQNNLLRSDTTGNNTSFATVKVSIGENANVKCGTFIANAESDLTSNATISDVSSLVRATMDIVKNDLTSEKNLTVSQENTGIPFGLINNQMSYTEFASTLTDENHTTVTNNIQNTLSMTNQGGATNEQRWNGSLEVDGLCEITAISTVDAVLDKIVDVAIDSFAWRETTNTTQTSSTTDVGQKNSNNLFLILGIIIIGIIVSVPIFVLIFYWFRKPNSGKEYGIPRRARRAPRTDVTGSKV